MSHVLFVREVMNQHHHGDVGAVFSDDSSLNLIILKVTHDGVTQPLETLDRLCLVQSGSFPSLLVELRPIEEDAVVDPSRRQHPTSLRNLFVASTRDDDVVGSRMDSTNFIIDINTTVNVIGIYSMSTFIQNKYFRWYQSLILHRKENPLPDGTYTESHHIIPRSLGGSNARENLVKLSAREHYICHTLLMKFTIGNDRYKMAYAFMRLSHKKTTKISSYAYQLMRQNFKLTDSVKAKISKSLTGKKHTPEARAKISSNHRRHQTAETSEKISKSKRGIATRGAGWTTSEETKQRQSAAQKGRLLSEEHKAKLRKPKKKLTPTAVSSTLAASEY